MRKKLSAGSSPGLKIWSTSKGLTNLAELHRPRQSGEQMAGRSLPELACPHLAIVFERTSCQLCDRFHQLLPGRAISTDSLWQEHQKLEQRSMAAWTVRNTISNYSATMSLYIDDWSCDHQTAPPMQNFNAKHRADLASFWLQKPN